MEDGDDPLKTCKGCRIGEVLKPYDDLFMGWFQQMLLLWELKRAGYPFRRNDLSLIEWRVLGILDQHFEKLQWQPPIP